LYQPIVIHDPATGPFCAVAWLRAKSLSFRGAFFRNSRRRGTVFFAGYTSLLTEPQGLRFRKSAPYKRRIFSQGLLPLPALTELGQRLKPSHPEWSAPPR